MDRLRVDLSPSFRPSLFVGEYPCNHPPVYPRVSVRRLWRFYRYAHSCVPARQSEKGSSHGLPFSGRRERSRGRPSRFVLFVSPFALPKEEERKQIARVPRDWRERGPAMSGRTGKNSRVQLAVVSHSCFVNRAYRITWRPLSDISGRSTRFTRECDRSVECGGKRKMGLLS